MTPLEKEIKNGRVTSHSKEVKTARSEKLHRLILVYCWHIRAPDIEG